MSLLNPSQPALGLGIANTVIRARNGDTEDAVAGMVMQFDFARTAVGTNSSVAPTSSAENNPDSVLCIVKRAKTSVRGIYGVWIDNVPAGGFGRLCLRGVVKARAFATGGTAGVQYGESLTCATTYAGLRSPGAAGTACVALALEQTTASAIDINTYEVITVLFNGVEHFNETSA
jgi:hypothetical protein